VSASLPEPETASAAHKGAPLKVLINALSARRGGGQTYLSNILDRIDLADGLEVVILAPASLQFTPDPRITRWAPACSANPLARALWEKCCLPGVLRSTRADVLFCPGGLINAKVPAGCRSVTMSQNMIPFTPGIRKQYPLGWQRVRNWLLEHAMLKSMAQADLVIFISEYARGVIEAHAGGPFTKTITIPHGLSDHFRIDPANEPARPGWLPDGDYLLYVSLFETYKHHLELVRGFHLLKALRPTREKLVLAGKNDLPAGRAVREEIARLGLQDDVILTGNIDYRELPAVYRHAKVNLFASGCENCPNILLEALGAGRALLVSNLPPMPEFGGDAVVYFDPASPDDFARQLAALIDRPAELERLGGLAAEQARQYDWNATARRTWSALGQLAAGTAPERN
jgi:glycosyltransferase involved in cell wall biosynthesis